MARRPELAQLVGAANARPRRQIPRSETRGLPGCRAPAGRFAVTVPAWPPSKSNTYRRVTYRAQDPATGASVERRGLAVSEVVRDFETELALAVMRAYQRLDYAVAWYRRVDGASSAKASAKASPPSPPRPSNPLFGHDVEVDVEITLREPLRTNRDTGNVEKVVGDVLTSCAVWWDDVQVRDVAIRRVTSLYAGESTTIAVLATGETASWAPLRGHWPLSTAAAARELKRRQAAAMGGDA